jgi:beta-propeller repeat-containing protein
MLLKEVFTSATLCACCANSISNCMRFAGVTSSTDLPTVSPFQAANHSTSSINAFNAFVAKFNAAGGGLMYSTYLGGSNSDGANAIAVDSLGNAYVAGVTSSPDFPLVDPLQNMNNGTVNGAADAFVSVLNAAGSALTFSTYLGGSGSASAARRGAVRSMAPPRSR